MVSEFARLSAATQISLAGRHPARLIATIGMRYGPSGGSASLPWGT